MNSARGDFAEKWDHIQRQILIISTEHYIVVIDKDGDVDWETSREYDIAVLEDKAYDLEKHNSTLNNAAFLEAFPCGNFDATIKLHFKRLLGEAIGCSLDHDYVGAENMLALAGQYIRARSEEMSRFWYLSASFVVTAAFVLTGLIVWIKREEITLILSSTGMWLILAAVAGTAGALLSVIWRSGNLKFDSSSGRTLHYLEASSRILAGALSGFLTALAVKYELILPALTRGENLHGILMLAAMAAGTSERMATSIISKFESQETKPKNVKAAKSSGRNGET